MPCKSTCYAFTPIKNCGSGEDILFTCDNLEEHALALDCQAALLNIRNAALHSFNGAKWIKEKFKELQDLSDVMRLQTKLWN